MLFVRFWGVRGSIPCPGPTTVKYGGNTACLEIRADKRLIIVDMGTGIRPLGDRLIATDFKTSGAIKADVFVTHTHWDHIMGFPVFSPIFMRQTSLCIRGPVSFDDDTLESIISAQLSYRYWPVRVSELAAHITYEQIRETSLDLGGGLRVISKFLNHPILCLGYRFEYQGKSIVAFFDHEPFRNVFPTDPNDPTYDEDAAHEGELAAAEENDRISRFFCGADILIHDAQYTDAEYTAKRIGWGHSTFEQAIAGAVPAKVKKLVFFHHDPARTDEELAELEKTCRLNAAAPELEIMMAREGMVVEA